MLLLAGNITADGVAVGWTDGECAISFLPFECAISDLIMNPLRGNRLDIPHYIGKRSSGVETKENVHMIGHTTDGLGNGVGCAGHAADKSVETITPFHIDAGLAVLR